MIPIAVLSRSPALPALLAVCLLAACNRAPAPEAAGNPVSAQDALPAECESYINRVKSCVANREGDQAAQQFQQSLDQMRAQWAEAADKTALVPACQQANAAFDAMAQQFGCE